MKERLKDTAFARYELFLHLFLGQKVSDLVALNIGQIGENIILRRGVSITVGEGASVEGVTHPSANPMSSNSVVQYGRYGSLVTYTQNDNVKLIPEDQTPGIDR